MSGPAVLLIVLLVCMVIGVPIAWSLCISCFAAICTLQGMPVTVLSQRIFTGADSFSLLAVPAFIVAGDIMSAGGISKRLINMASVFVGRIRGSLAIVSIVACTFFAALSGSANATTAAIGGIMYPEMVKRKYPEDFSAAVQAIGGTLGPIIPPSILFVFYGISTGVPIPKLLVSGLIPGILSCVLLCLVAMFMAKKYNIPIEERKSSAKEKVAAVKDAFWALLMPIIILGGIYAGIFTPTESAGVAVIYGIIVSLFIYKELTFKELLNIFKKSAVTTGNLIILVAGAQMFGWLVAYFNIPKIVATWIEGIAHSPITFLLLVNLILLVAGMFMEAMAIIVIMAPILAPIAANFGIDPVHFGLVVVFMLSLGIATPPFGPCLYVACGISKRPFIQVSKQLLPFIAVQIFAALLFTFVPGLSTVLVNLM